MHIQGMHILVTYPHFVHIALVYLLIDCTVYLACMVDKLYIYMYIILINILNWEIKYKLI